MKLKGLTKLVLAGTALAATAATLTTSTYAWYVVNTTVKAEGLSGATAGTNIGGSVLISYADTDTLRPVEYTTKLDFTTDSKVSDGELLPVTKSEAQYALTTDTTFQENKEYYTKSGNAFNKATVTAGQSVDANTYYEISVAAGTWVDRDGKPMSVVAEGTKGESGYVAPKIITYQFWLKASEATSVTVKTTFTNTTAPVSPATDVLKQTFYSETGLPTGKNKNDSFAVDAVYALRMEAVETQYDVTEDTYETIADETAYNAALAAETAYTKSGSTYTKVAPATAYDAGTTYYNKTANASMTVKKDGENKDLTKSTIVSAVKNHETTVGAAYTKNAYFDDWTGGDANKYYYSIMKTAGYGTTAADGTSASEPNTTWTTVALAKDVDTLITLTIWLEGTDAQCWDSCVGQTFKLDVQFDA